ncbi:MAG: 50S ribosomal protein L10 [candidate division Zixibacteria bacterium]|nr:50S ribosomal protein L10 [candidate division Zixibacteria bacterium]
MFRAEKEKVVSQLKDKLSQTKSLFLTDFTGLNVEEMTELRKNFREKKVEYKIAKNSLIRLAVQQTGFEGISDHLGGPTGLVFGYDDLTVPAKVLYDFQKKIEKPKIKVFWMEGKLFGEEKLKRLAQLSSREDLFGQIVLSLNSPMTNLVGTLEGVLRNFIGLIDALLKVKSKTS